MPSSGSLKQEPKSPSRMCPSAVSRILSGLISLEGAQGTALISTIFNKYKNKPPLVPLPWLQWKIYTWTVCASFCGVCAVPVDVTQFVHRVNGHDHLSQVELSHVLREPITKLAEQSQQVAPYIIVHYQILRQKLVGEWEKWPLIWRYDISKNSFKLCCLQTFSRLKRLPVFIHTR